MAAATAQQIVVVLARQVPLPPLPEVRLILSVIGLAICDAMTTSRSLTSHRIESRRWLFERRYRRYAELISLDTEMVADLCRRAGCEWIDVPDLPQEVLAKPSRGRKIGPRKTRSDSGKPRNFYNGVATMAAVAPADSSRH